ncbi:hypothetical protein SCHPADRAFT_946273 [Schizopora paradoxa]|uniref:Uncharacterized protein n=1 Tax=Schizopora paradoxa TaxID=27342 RepID=A0A0H2R367_9AGAM|nr:hypothetical protein SCHPADRAFT_946273 [Schizopora paradoxa]
MSTPIIPTITQRPSNALPIEPAPSSGIPTSSVDVELDANGHPDAFTPEQMKFLKQHNEDYLTVNTKRKNGAKKAWFEKRHAEFYEAFPGFLINNSTSETEAKIDRHFYNFARTHGAKLAKAALDKAAPALATSETTTESKASAVDMAKCSLFSFEEAPEIRSALALFTEENKVAILSLVKMLRTEKGLDTTANLPLYNQVRSDEYKKLSDEDKAIWEAHAKEVTEQAFRDWEKPDDDVILRNQNMLKQVLTHSLNRLIGHAKHQVGDTLKIHLDASLTRADGQIISFEINIGRDALGVQYNNSPQYKEGRPDEVWASWNKPAPKKDLQKGVDKPTEIVDLSNAIPMDTDDEDKDEVQPRRRVHKRGDTLSSPIHIDQDVEGLIGNTPRESPSVVDTTASTSAPTPESSAGAVAMPSTEHDPVNTVSQSTTHPATRLDSPTPVSVPTSPATQNTLPSQSIINKTIPSASLSPATNALAVPTTPNYDVPPTPTTNAAVVSAITVTNPIPTSAGLTPIGSALPSSNSTLDPMRNASPITVSGLEAPAATAVETTVIEEHNERDENSSGSRLKTTAKATRQSTRTKKRKSPEEASAEALPQSSRVSTRASTRKLAEQTNQSKRPRRK